MLYLQHYGLDELPFGLTPDTSFFYAYPVHQEALNTLLVAVQSGEPFVKVVGEVGTGKTLLCRLLLNSLGEDYATAWLPNPLLNPQVMLLAIARELGVEQPERAGQHRYNELITERLVALRREGRHPVLIIDEAQALPAETLELVRLLTNLETEKEKLLQVVLFGQPELDERLASPGLRQLLQRITFAARLRPLERQAVEDYLEFRLRAAGYRGGRLFSRAAVRRIAEASGGLPRLINILAHKTLLAGFGRQMRQLGRKEAEAAIADTEIAQRLRPAATSQWHWLVLGVLAGLLLLAAGWAIQDGQRAGWLPPLPFAIAPAPSAVPGAELAPTPPAAAPADPGTEPPPAQPAQSAESAP